MIYNVSINRIIKDYLNLSAATLLIALAVKEYLIPCQIVTGSISGLALLLNEMVRVDNSLLVLILNMLCLLIGICYLGKKFGIRCIYISLLLPLLIRVIPQADCLISKSDIINISAFLLLLTAGQYIMILMDTTSGGLDTIAEVLSRKLHLSLGLTIALLGCVISVLTVGVYGLRAAVIGSASTVMNGVLINTADRIFSLCKAGK